MLVMYASSRSFASVPRLVRRWCPALLATCVLAIAAIGDAYTGEPPAHKPLSAGAKSVSDGRHHQAWPRARAS